MSEEKIEQYLTVNAERIAIAFAKYIRDNHYIPQSKGWKQIDGRPMSEERIWKRFMAELQGQPKQ